jgi:ureidoglycolate hydrolase
MWAVWECCWLLVISEDKNGRKENWDEVKSFSSKQNQVVNLHSDPMLHWGVKGTDDDDDDVNYDDTDDVSPRDIWELFQIVTVIIKDYTDFFSK